jgi:hypothetical protein
MADDTSRHTSTFSSARNHLRSLPAGIELNVELISHSAVESRPAGRPSQGERNEPTEAGWSGFIDTVRALTKPLKADRLLPPLPGTPPEAFERLYAGRADPWGVLLLPIALDKLLTLGRTVIVAYTSRERSRIEAHLDRLYPPESRVFHPFFGLKNHGFTIACLRGCGDVT